MDLCALKVTEQGQKLSAETLPLHALALLLRRLSPIPARENVSQIGHVQMEYSSRMLVLTRVWNTP